MNATTGLDIDMGGGIALHLSDDGEGRWLLAFNRPAPALDAVEVQAIARNGQCLPMKMFAGPKGNAVYASGPVERAYRVRIVVKDGAAARRRDMRLPGTADYPLAKGARGGTFVSMGHDSFVEVLPENDACWRVVFHDKETLTAAPPVADVVAEAITPPGVDDQVRGLTVRAGADGHSLVLEGKVGDADHLRLAVMMGDHYHTRCVPVLRP